MDLQTNQNAPYAGSGRSGWGVTGVVSVRFRFARSLHMIFFEDRDCLVGEWDKLGEVTLSWVLAPLGEVQDGDTAPRRRAAFDPAASTDLQANCGVGASPSLSRSRSSGGGRPAAHASDRAAVNSAVVAWRCSRVRWMSPLSVSTRARALASSPRRRVAVVAYSSALGQSLVPGPLRGLQF